MELEFEMEPLGLPLVAWLLVGLRTPLGVGSFERWPPVLGLIGLATLYDQVGPLGNWFQFDAPG